MSDNEFTPNRIIYLSFLIVNFMSHHVESIIRIFFCLFFFLVQFNISKEKGDKGDSNFNSDCFNRNLDGYYQNINNYVYIHTICYYLVTIYKYRHFFCIIFFIFISLQYIYIKQMKMPSQSRKQGIRRQRISIRTYRKIIRLNKSINNETTLKFIENLPQQITNDLSVTQFFNGFSFH